MVEEELVVFAMARGLAPNEAMVLPALFEKAADEVGMSVRGLISSATYSNEVGEYLAKVAREVARKL